MDYYDLGPYRRDITARVPEAQRWFNRGLNWCYGYNHEEALSCFEKALEHDADCAMAHWGIAYAIGPNYNKPWEAFDDDDKRNSLERALAATEAALSLAEGASPFEQALIRALPQRYPKSPEAEDFGPWNDAYAAAMREVHAAQRGKRL